MLDIKKKGKFENALGTGWKIGELLGEGSYGSVYEVEKNDVGTTFKSALKIIPIPKNDTELNSIRAEMNDDDSVRTYFESVAKELTSELTVMAKLKGNTNIVSYEDHMILTHEDGLGLDILIRMELLVPLLQYTKNHAPDRELVLKLGTDMCNALCVCERYNIIHRDIKPANIFVSESGDFKLGDFGVAKISERATTGASTVAGSREYMAPEIEHGGGKYRKNVDVYSLGIVLYQLANHMRLPFYPRYPEPIYASDKGDSILKRMRGDKLPLPDDADKQLSKVILKACEHSPNNRYASAADLLFDLRRVSENKRIRIVSTHDLRLYASIGTGLVLITVIICAMVYRHSKKVADRLDDDTSLVEAVDSNDIDELVSENEVVETNTESVSDNNNDTASEDMISENDISENNISGNSISRDSIKEEKMDYDAVYAPVLEEYVKVFEGDYAMYGRRVPEDFSYMAASETFKMDDIYYVFYDLDGDGIDEMLILNRKYGDDLIYAVYELMGNQVIPVSFSVVGRELDGLYLFEDGIVGKMREGTGFFSRSFCRLNSKDYVEPEWELIETVARISDYQGISTFYSSTDPDSIEYAPDEKPEIYEEVPEEWTMEVRMKYENVADIERKSLTDFANTLNS